MNNNSFKSTGRNWSEKFDISEPFLFYAVVAISAIPVLLTAYFPTLDGPAHLYNAKLIVGLLKGDGNLTDFFMINNVFLPNWSGHFILALFCSFLPAIAAEKIFLIIYIISFPLSFRWLIKRMKGNLFITWLILPFTFSFMFYLGFYNFFLGVVFFFLGLSIWVDERKKKPLDFVFTLILSICIFYSHIFVFAIFILCLAAILLFGFIRDYIVIGKAVTGKFMKTCFWLIVSLASALILSVLFLKTHSAPNHASKIIMSDLFRWLYKIRCLVAFNFESEGRFTKLLFLLLAVLSVIFFIQFIKKTFLEKSREQVDKHVTWASLCLLVLILYFVLPDEMGSGGYISVRLNMFFFIMLIILLGQQKYTSWIKQITVIIVIFVTAGLAFSHYKETSRLNKTAMAVKEASQRMDSHNVVLPLMLSENWMEGHISNYAGAEKPLVMLDNYETAMDYFPLKWNDAQLPVFFFPGNDTINTCDLVRKSNNQQKKKINYIMFIGNKPDTTKACIREILHYSKNHTSNVYKSEMVSVFKCR